MEAATQMKLIRLVQPEGAKDSFNYVNASEIVAVYTRSQSKTGPPYSSLVHSRTGVVLAVREFATFKQAERWCKAIVRQVNGKKPLAAREMKQRLPTKFSGLVGDISEMACKKISSPRKRKTQ